VVLADASFLVNGVEQSSTDDLVLFEVRPCLLTAASDPCFDSGSQLVMNGFGLRFSDSAPQTLAAFLYADSHPGDVEFIRDLLDGLDFGIANPRVETEAVPEPAAAGLVLLGLAGLWVSGRRRESR
jgi:hypothetical protein